MNDFFLIEFDDLLEKYIKKISDSTPIYNNFFFENQNKISW